MNPICGIYALCDTTYQNGDSHLVLAEKLLKGGVRILQLRMKGEKDEARIIQTTRDILTMKKNYEFTFILNDFVDIALTLGADGIHVGADDATVSDVKKLAGFRVLVGYSAHSLSEALEAEQRGADYVALGAVFPTETKKPGHPVVGLELLRDTVAALQVPVVAIGGINRSNFSQVLDTGAASVAMIGALTQAPDVTREAKYFVGQFELNRTAPS